LLLLLVAAFNPVVLYYSSVTYSEMPYLFFLVFSFWMYLKNKQFLAVLFASISYLIRPEGLIFAVAYAIIFFIKDRRWKNFSAATLIILSILLLFMFENHSRNGEWSISSKFSNLKIYDINNWTENEEFRYVKDESNNTEIIQSLLDQYPKRLMVLFNYIKTSSTWPITILGFIGLFWRPNIFWIFVVPLLFTPLSGANMSLRYGLPYFYALLIGSGFLINKISTRQNLQLTVAFVALISVVFIFNLKYLLQTSIIDNDFNFVEGKGVGIFIEKAIPEDAIIMDRKPYVAFYSNAGKYIEIPTGSIDDVLLSLQENDVDFLILSKRIITKYRPNLLPLLNEDEDNVKPLLKTIYNDNYLNNDFSTRIYKINK
ncbi:DUF2079 domain-containing protein, partial [Candidatus Neomarinimicrobiota bacterium]